MPDELKHCFILARDCQMPVLFECCNADAVANRQCADFGKNGGDGAVDIEHVGSIRMVCWMLKVLLTNLRSSGEDVQGTYIQSLGC